MDNKTNRPEKAWAPIVAAMLLLAAFMSSLIGSVTENPYTLAYAGVLGLAGIGVAILSLRDL